jgi:prolyl oligopeptidase PreP (S9A serine peptidase family)
MARAGIWYTKNIEVKNTVYQAPKGFRRCDNLTLENIAFTHAQETLWSCNDVKIKDVTVKGDYFAMNCSNMEIDNLILDGNYSFDGVKNMTIRNSHLISKDAFWNTENVTVYDSFITGEYLGWNAKNLTLVNCVIESLQGMCYVDNLVMKDCKLFNTNLAFEYSNVNAEITGDVISVLNPKSGTIKAEHIKELIIEKDKIDPSATKIICDAIDKHSDHPVYD